MLFYYQAEPHPVKLIRVAFESETLTHLYKDGFKVSKKPTEGRGYFPSFELAKQYLIEKQEARVASLVRRLNEETKKLESLQELEEVTSEPSQDLQA